MQIYVSGDAHIIVGMYTEACDFRPYDAYFRSSLESIEISAKMARSWWMSFWSWRHEMEELLAETAANMTAFSRDQICKACAMEGHWTKDCPTKVML